MVAGNGDNDGEAQRAVRPTLGPNEATIDRALVGGLVPRRRLGAHKWGVGGLVVVAGAPGFAGAAVLCALAAGRNGAGIVNVALPRSLSAPVVMAVPEAATVLLSDGEPRRSVEAIEEKLEQSAAILIGPGLSQDEAAGDLLAAIFGLEAARSAIGFGFESGGLAASGDGGLLGRAGKPGVLDADALNWLARQPDWPSLLPSGRAVVTPHVGELARLLAASAAELIADPVRTTREAAKAWGQTVVFKHGYTAVSDGARTLVAEDAPLSLATAGSGDVLAGAIAAYLAQGLAPMDAAALAVYVGMKAARRLEERFGTLGVVAGDLPSAMAEVLASLEREGAEESP
ncbi:MAG: NAD(P)H-hydrate dehydratase [Chloroflexia bacterium]|nr:NAD(P)H-hydrate dehydratase [Chloroflexia bacterium]